MFQYFSQLNICDGEKILWNEILKSNYRLFLSDKHLRLDHKVRNISSWFHKKNVSPTKESAMMSQRKAPGISSSR